MNRLPWGLLPLVLAGLAGRAGAAVAQIDKGLACEVHAGVGDTVRRDSLLPLILVFENQGEPRTIHVRTGPEIQVSTTLSVPQGRSVKRCHYLPVPRSGSGASMRGYLHFADAASGRALGDLDLSSELASLSYPEEFGTSSSTPLLVGVSLSRATAMAVNEDLDPAFKLRISKASPSLLPDSWLGYTGIDLVVIECDVWTAPGFDKQPLIDWMAMGGVCLFVGASDEERADVVRSVSSQAPFFRPGAQADRFYVASGGAAFVTRPVLAGSHQDFWKQRGFLPFLTARLSHGLSPEYPPIEGMGEPPFWSVLFALVPFSILVGPVGWWWLVSRKKAALFYYLAAPAASLCAIILIVVLSLLHEGFRPFVSSAAVRFIDQRVSKSIDAAQFGVYAPLGFGAALRGSANEWPCFLAPDREHADVSAPGWAVTEGRRDYVGVLPVRSPRWFAREELRVERRRLLVSDVEGKIQVENHLGFDLQKLTVGHKGKLAYFASLPAGARRSADAAASNGALAAWNADGSEFQTLLRSSVAGRSGRAAAEWLKAFSDTGNFYFALCPDLAREQLWLASFREHGATAMVLGVY